ncbi:hypothetical protein AKJ09_10514 [Labilithrix luteola]|uniref:Tat (Twin-arginine translocation) pathway signal sequence domain protein n=1 Tax=Labilithrix luteola TaxID=1391654 RepID=A0A0K1QDJ9_9BACT|nr:DUF1552 domain-containing protein [Labilithrix luteola]AKV03851.1 hypothetical protein AKJ09_10514 [Labilithrix luteola]
MSHRITRRNLIAAAGGALMLVPFLSSRKGRADTPTYPKRLLILQSTNGVMPKWWPTGSATSLTLSDQFAPLTPHKNDLVVLKGLSIQAEKDSPRNGAGHTSLPYLLTGSMDAPGPVINDGFTQPLGNSISVDQFVAGKLSPTPIRSLQLSAYFVHGDYYSRALSFNGPAVNGVPNDNPPEIDPYKVFSRLAGFGIGNDGKLAAARARKKSVLDGVSGDLDAMLKKVGADDKAKIQVHLDSVANLEKELSIAAAACSLPAQTSGIGIQPSDHNFDKILKMQIDLAATAFACGLTNVATLMMMGPANDLVCFPFLGPEFKGTVGLAADPSGAEGGSHHSLAHFWGNSPSLTAQKAKVDTFFNAMVAYAIEKLKSIPEGAGTVFDNTMIVFMNNMSDGHGLDDIPTYVAGGSWYLKGGRMLDFKGVPHNGLLTGIANAFGGDVTTFGDAKYGGELSNWRA